MENKEEVCPTCGHKLIEYRHSINKGIVSFLIKLYEVNGPVKTNTLVGGAYSQWTNYTKLAYWGLAIPHENEESIKKKGWWVITEKGKQFVRGLIKIQKTAILKCNVIQRYEGKEVGIIDIDEGYKYYSDYADQVRGEISDAEE